MIAIRTPVKLNGISALVADPCYFESSEHMLYEVKNLQQFGDWMLEITREEMIGGWGERPVELTVVHSTYRPEHVMSWEHQAGVDSGQMSICGSLDIERFGGQSDSFDPDGNAGQFNYEGACDITLNTPESGGVLCGIMAVCSSGIGDGSYPVFVGRDPNGMATRITVDFRFAEDDEDDEDEDEVDDDGDGGGEFEAEREELATLAA